jgi:thiopurine S-methyltransferase
MDEHFWHSRWERNDTPFHQAEINPFLMAHFGALALPAGSRVFVPLCGRTRDIHWLLAQGYRVAGAELSAIAIDQLFADLDIEPHVTTAGPLRRYSADRIDIFVGDIFDLPRGTLGPVDAVYDRAALVALPEPMRDRYAAHLAAITGRAPQLVIVFEYDQRLLEGPPFAVSGDEVRRHYEDDYALTRLVSAEITGGLKGRVAATEHVWLLTTRGDVA